MSGPSAAPPAWPGEVFAILKGFAVRQVAYVPDAGHAELIRRIHADPQMQPVPLTTEEEGVALLCGAWLGGDRGVLLMQSSGVGNCINMLALARLCRVPLLALVTMRGEWGEFNPWQVPMGTATPDVLRLMGMHVLRAERAGEIAETVQAGAALAFDGAAPTAVLFAQRALGAKDFRK